MASHYGIQQGRARGLFPDSGRLGDDRLRWLGGTPGTALEDRWLFTLSREDEPLWQAAVLFEPGGPFVEALVWEEAGVVLFGGGETCTCPRRGIPPEVGCPSPSTC